MCRDIDPSSAEISSQCAHLTPYGVTARYPNELLPHEDMVKLALKEARQVYDFVIASGGQDTPPSNCPAFI